MGERRGMGWEGRNRRGGWEGGGRGREGRGKGRGCGGARKVVCPGAHAGSRRAWPPLVEPQTALGKQKNTFCGTPVSIPLPKLCEKTASSHNISFH